MNVAGASSVALSGFDPVSFFRESAPVNGSPFISAEHRGATYFFASEANKTRFLSAPDTFAPQFGGFCSYGVSIGKLLPVDITTAQVRNGKLYLNLNPDIRVKFDEDFAGNVGRAEQNWPGLFEQNAK
ncbi:MAG: YHS domain-containing (seleno)protein [Phycisphaerales bacterium]